MKKTINMLVRIPFTLALMFLISSNSVFCSESTIPNASYLVYQGAEGNSRVIQTIQTDSKYATFYDAYGNEIKKIYRSSCKDFNEFSNLRKKLDPNAPKPQPVTYKIWYWNPVKKGQPGHFIAFYDKNGNVIKDCRYCPKTKTITVLIKNTSIPCEDYTIRNIKIGSLVDLPLVDLEIIDTSVVKEARV